MIGYRKPALDRVFSPGGCILASGFSDGTIELADLMTGAINHKFKGHSVFPVESLQISPNGKLLVSFSPHEGRTRLWDVTSGRLFHEIATGFQKLMSRRMAFSPDSQALALVGYDGISLWDTRTGNCKTSLIHIRFRERESNIHDVREFAFTSDSSMLVVAWANKFITGWNCSTAGLELSYETQPDIILSAALASDGQKMQMASGGVDDIVRLWDLAALTVLEVESNEIESMSMSANGRLLVSKYVPKTIYPPFFHPPSPFRCPPPLGVWDTTTGVCNHKLQVHSNHSERAFTSRGDLTILISAIAFSPDNQMIALMSNYTNRTGTIQDKISLWNARTGTQKGTLHTALPNGQQPLSSSPCLEFSQSDLLACGMDYTVILWDTKTGAQLKYWRVDQKVTKLEFFNGGPSLESNLNITGLRKFGHETHLRTNFGVLDSGNDTFWKNPFQVRLVALALRRKRNLRNAFGSMMIRTGEREERTSQMPITLMQDGISGQSNTQNQAISQVSLETNNQWITLNGKKAIWLPPEFRPLTFEVGMRDNHTIIALGLKSGDVCFIGFRM
jgi:WD40 repeat protein